MVARVFAVLSAAFLVTAVGLAALTPTGMSLGLGLATISQAALGWLQAHCPAFLWDVLFAPFLQRPAWLPPAFIGLICAGVALTFNLGKPSPSRRRRS